MKKIVTIPFFAIVINTQAQIKVPDKAIYLRLFGKANERYAEW